MPQQYARSNDEMAALRNELPGKVSLVPVQSPESASVVGAFPRQLPAGVQFFIQLGLVEAPGRPDQFEAATDRLTLFRVEPR